MRRPRWQLAPGPLHDLPPTPPPPTRHAVPRRPRFFFHLFILRSVTPSAAHPQGIPRSVVFFPIGALLPEPAVAVDVLMSARLHGSPLVCAERGAGSRGQGRLRRRDQGAGSKGTTSGHAAACHRPAHPRLQLSRHKPSTLPLAKQPVDLMQPESTVAYRCCLHSQMGEGERINGGSAFTTPGCRQAAPAAAAQT